ncbi:gamma-interferon-inducible lysosomal thiol reductase-like [Oppia nitens]|uniref:gamma-interferon-inducible lysosomal thiol reductase-like n=1 Tax=Oppia nitens TaxID=1686743 RepID=UPI0023DC881B|nr:gamma-interferon-inducible lysosomal thiol reductase-like [Oppia nitens]
MIQLVKCLTIFMLFSYNSHEIFAANTIQIGAYIESLCPDSRDFVNQQLWPTYEALKAESPPVISVNLVPFGNADMTFVSNSTTQPMLTYTCQHKGQECLGNIIQSCAFIKLDLDKSLGLTNCMFKSTNWRTPYQSSAQCAKDLNIDFTVLSDCANSLEGLAIEYFMSGQTRSLEPKHNWIPWVTLNGVHTQQIQDEATTDLLGLICKTYRGSTTPKACQSKL